MSQTDITLRKIFQAQKRIAGMVRHTPLVESPSMSDRLGKSILLKLECLQKTGSFKLRGAANALLSLSDAQKKKGVLAFSTGNHGRAVAYVAGRLGMKCVVCLSERVPQYRVAAMEKFEAIVVQKGKSQDDAYEHHGILIEGAAAVTLAWLLKPEIEIPGNHIAGILSGGNVDTNLAFDILSRYISKNDNSIT